jgi:hypothetical protein
LAIPKSIAKIGTTESEVKKVKADALSWHLSSTSPRRDNMTILRNLIKNDLERGSSLERILQTSVLVN